MRDVIISPARLCGEVHAIPSKSDAHRALICAALSDAPVGIRLRGFISGDIEATLRCLRALGAKAAQEGGDIIVTPIKNTPYAPVLDCGESGSTLRFLLPVAAALGGGGTFIGSGRLPERPIGPLMDALSSGGVSFDSDKLPLTLSGSLRPGEYTLSGSVSSQFISGLLLALPLVPGGGAVLLSSPLESAGYVDMTVAAMKRFGVFAEAFPGGWRVPEGPYRSRSTYEAEGDWSNAAFFLAAGAIGKEVRCSGLNPSSYQKDKQITALLERFGARLEWDGSTCTVFPGTLRGAGEINVTEIPDLVPILAVTAAFSPGETLLSGGARLRIKESDRLKTTTQMLAALGADITEGEDYLLIRGKDRLSGGETDSFGDHRIAMAAAIAATRCTGQVKLSGANAVNKSYPGFFEDYARLGGAVRPLKM